MVHLRPRPKRTYAGLGLFLSLLLIGGAVGVNAVADRDDGKAPAVESPATTHPVEPDQEPEPTTEAKMPKAPSVGAGTA